MPSSFQTFTLGQLNEKLPAWLEAGMNIGLFGPPGVGKTHNARAAAINSGKPYALVNGGEERAWRALFPYKLPSGVIELGTALHAAGYALIDGKPEKVREAGTIILDEVNRVPSSQKGNFQTLGAQKVVTMPDGTDISVPVSIIFTGNPSDLGVEEMSRAELDRYDLILFLQPTGPEVEEIVAREAKVSPEMAAAIYAVITDLSNGLDKSKFHQPEGIRMALSIAKTMRTGTLAPADVLKLAAERCFPHGRAGADRNRSSFDSTVARAAITFTQKVAQLGEAALTQRAVVDGSRVEVQSLPALLAALKDSTQGTVTVEPMPLPRPYTQVMNLVTTAFGQGIALHALRAQQRNKLIAERGGVIVDFGMAGQPDKIGFKQAPKAEVMHFLSLVTK